MPEFPCSQAGPLICKITGSADQGGQAEEPTGERRKSSERALSELLQDTMGYTVPQPGSTVTRRTERLETGAARVVQGPTYPLLLYRAAI